MRVADLTVSEVPRLSAAVHAAHVVASGNNLGVSGGKGWSFNVRYYKQCTKEATMLIYKHCRLT